MTLKRIRLWAAAAVAFLMGVPFATPAQAADGWDIFGASLNLAGAIIDVAGDS